MQSTPCPYSLSSRSLSITGFITPVLERKLELKLHRQLPNASIYRRTTDDAEGGRCEIGVGIRKLGMVQCRRVLLEKLELAPWASRRRQELLALLDRMNPTTAELTATAEQEANLIACHF